MGQNKGKIKMIFGKKLTATLLAIGAAGAIGSRVLSPYINSRVKEAYTSPILRTLQDTEKRLEETKHQLQEPLTPYYVSEFGQSSWPTYIERATQLRTKFQRLYAEREQIWKNGGETALQNRNAALSRLRKGMMTAYIFSLIPLGWAAIRSRRHLQSTVRKVLSNS